MFGFTLHAQKGVVSGNVIDAETGEDLIGVTVVIQGTTKGAITDFSGSYRIELDEGTYTLEYNYLSYQKHVIEGVIINAGTVQKIDVTLKADDIQLEAVVVQATAINNNEVALLKLQKKAYAVQDGISAVEIGRLGASNSAESMKQVTGASVEDGQFVVMRGLGDRYSITQMNGVTLPSTDPYRNSSSMDLIPTAMVENIVTKKTFTPDQPGNFTGGNVDITTKPIPDEFYLQTSFQFGVNTNASFRNDYLTDPLSGNSDWLGFDDGTRDIPASMMDPANRQVMRASDVYIDARNKNLDPNTITPVFDQTAKDMNRPVFVPETRSTGPNSKFTLAFGDRSNSGKIGYNAGLTYSKDFNRRPDYVSRFAEYRGDPATELGVNFDATGVTTSEVTNISGLVGIAYKFNERNELSFDAIYNHSGNSYSEEFAGINPVQISGQHLFESRIVNWQERELQNVKLNGKHVVPGFKNMEIEWSAVRFNYTQDEPLLRFLQNDLLFSNIDANGVPQDTTYRINSSEYAAPFYVSRQLEDVQNTAKLDLTIPLRKSDKLKVGGIFTKTDREFLEDRFQLNVSGTNESDPNYLSIAEAAGNWTAFFDPSNAGVVADGTPTRWVTGNFYNDNTLDNNRYEGFTQIWAVYAMYVWQMNEKWKFVGGLRMEKTDIEVTPGNPANSDNETFVIDELDALPSLNFIYAINDQSNLRISGSRTLARPNLREKAPFETVGRAGTLIVGNPDLEKTDITNIDLRYEIFPKAGEILAVSLFYKDFKDPINRITEVSGSARQDSWTNVDQARLGGIELEYRKGLGAWSPALEKFQLGTNFTYTYSRVDLDAEEFERNSEVNPEIKSWRPFQAQSPYIWNLNVSYLDFENGWESAVSMNLYGRRLTANGLVGAPDIYEIVGRDNKPVPTLNFTLTKNFGEHFSTTFKALNILNARYESNQEFMGDYFVNERFNNGVDFSLSLRYRY